jgi:hypothetical protein
MWRYEMEAGGSFRATVDEPRLGGREWMTTIKKRDGASVWMLRCSEQDLSDLGKVTSVARAYEGVGGVIAGLAASDGQRPGRGEEWLIAERPAIQKEFRQGRFGIVLGKLWLQDERVRYEAEIRSNGKPCLRCTEEDVRELSELATGTHDLVSNYLRPGRTLGEWWEKHRREEEREQTRTEDFEHER